jgi:glutathione-specific gamma-glutamylcyclotransferase
LPAVNDVAARAAATSPVAPLDAPIPAALVVRDPARLLDELRTHWHGERWIFAYGSLIWRPEFEAAERRAARVHGWHRPGGACRGVVYRLPHDPGDRLLERLWQREMPTGVYDPRLVRCDTAAGAVQALAFTLKPCNEACHPRLPDAQVLHILRHARGRYGSTLEYLAQTAEALQAHGVHDREIERLMALARRHGLV